MGVTESAVDESLKNHHRHGLPGVPGHLPFVQLGQLQPTSGAGDAVCPAAAPDPAAAQVHEKPNRLLEMAG